MDSIAQTSPYALCTTDSPYGPGISAASCTALGTFHGIRASVAHGLHKDSLRGVHVALQGVGNVGSVLLRYLLDDNAQVTVSDIDASRTHYYTKNFGVKAVAPSDLLTLACDVFAPCALGGILNAESIPQLNCTIVAGAANNQLRTQNDAELLHKRGILYVPDYLINAGGLTYAIYSYEKRSPDALKTSIHRLYDHVSGALVYAKRHGISAQQASRHLADTWLKSQPAQTV